MKFRPKTFLIPAIFFMCTGIMVLANGFIIHEQGARAAGMANAFVARASDPSAIWYNPAGIIQLEGFQIYGGGVSVNIGENKYYSIYRDNTLITDSLSNIYPNIYLSYKLSDKIAFGLAINSPVNYKIEWPQTSEMEHVVYVLSKIEIQSLAISPVIAYKLNDRLSLGAGINIYSFRFNFQYHYPFDTDVMVASLTNGEVLSVPDTVFDLDKFKTNKISFFAGLQWRPSPALSFGITYRRGIHLTFDSGSVNAFEPITPNAYANSKLADLFPDSPEQSATITFPLVDQLNTGLALKIGDSFDIELDLSFIFWSQMKTLKIDYTLDTYFRSFWRGYFDIEGNLHFKDTINLQLGGEYRLTKAIDLRFGTFYQGSPVVLSRLNPAFPFSDCIGFSLGLGYHTNNFNIDIAYVFQSISEIESDSDLFSRWGDTSQKYLSRKDNSFILNAGFRF